MSSLDNEETLPPINVSASKKRRNLPGRPDPDAEVIALSPRSLLTTNRFVCEICSKGFQRDQNLQLHRRGHNLPWRLKQRESHEYRKKVYICPEPNCVHHDPARALGDLTGIKKHFSRKHGEKKWKCDKCSKRYAVHSDWKAHQKTCGTKEYRCDCGYLFSRKDSFVTHRAFCEVLENNKGPPCDDEPVQKPAASPDEIANVNMIERDMPASKDAPASTASPVTGSNGPTCLEFPKPKQTERGSDPAMPASAIAAVSSKWMQGGIGANNCGSKQGSDLSLCLGTNLGPGPPGEAHVLATQNTGIPTFGYPSPRGQNKLEFSQLASSASQISSKHIPSVGAMSMLASLFSSSAHRQSGVEGSDSVACAFSTGDYTQCSLSAGLLSSTDDARSAHGLSKSYQHISSAATSATALLQKAAELGAKASNPSVCPWYGMGGRDSNNSLTGTQGARESPWADVRDSHKMGVESIARASDCLKSTGFWGSTSLSRKGDSMRAVDPSAGTYLPASSVLNLPLRAEVHDDSSAVLKHGHVNDNGRLGTMLSDYGFVDQMGCVKNEGGGLQTGEKEKQMVDFLGVDTGGKTVGRSHAGTGQILSHRDLPNMKSLMAGNRGPKRFHDPYSSVG